MLWLLACLAPTPPATVQSPTGAEIMDRWVQARGRRVPHTTHSSAVLQGHTGELRRSFEDGSVEESLRVGDIELGWGLTPEQAWLRSPGLSRALGGQAAALAWEAELNGDWRQVVEVELVGEDEGAWVLERRWAWGSEDIAWFDQQTGLLKGRSQDSPSEGPPDTLAVLRYEEHLGMQLPAELLWGREPLLVHERLERVEAGARVRAPELALKPAELERVPGPELMVEAHGLDRPVPMLVDTGASASLVPSRGEPALELAVDTPGGSTIAELVAVPDLAGNELGAAVALELPYGLLGRDLLSRGVLAVEPQRVLLLPELPDTTGLRAVPLRLGRDGQPLVELQLGSAALTVLLDTGASTLVNRRGAARAGLEPGGRSAGFVMGLEGQQVPLFHQDAPALSVEGVALCPLDQLGIAELSGLPGITESSDGAGLLGLDALPPRWVLDLAGGTLWLGDCAGEVLENGHEALGP